MLAAEFSVLGLSGASPIGLLSCHGMARVTALSCKVFVVQNYPCPVCSF